MLTGKRKKKKEKFKNNVLKHRKRSHFFINFICRVNYIKSNQIIKRYLSQPTKPWSLNSTIVTPITALAPVVKNYGLYIGNSCEQWVVIITKQS